MVFSQNKVLKTQHNFAFASLVQYYLQVDVSK